MIGLRRLMMAGGGGGPVSLTAFNPASLSPLATLSGSGRTLGANAPGQYANARSLAPIVGKRYFSALCARNGSQNYGFGICDETMLTGNSAWAGSGNSAAYWLEGRVYMGGTSIYQAGALLNTTDIQVAVNATTRQFWMRAAGSGWVGGGDPATGASPIGTLPGTGAIYIVASVDSRGTANGTITLPATSALVTGTPPVGFAVGVPA